MKYRQVLATLVLISVAFLYNSIEWYDCCFVLSFFIVNIDNEIKIRYNLLINQ